mmetsp:Transcript_10914/g.23100  ORF Transcript_10914/g.23100 Transcript_10914/m.23100 type:complete len:255 (+) Transcript_10914:774-1538(+)
MNGRLLLLPALSSTIRAEKRIVEGKARSGRSESDLRSSSRRGSLQYNSSNNLNTSSNAVTVPCLYESSTDTVFPRPPLSSTISKGSMPRHLCNNMLLCCSPQAATTFCCGTRSKSRHVQYGESLSGDLELCSIRHFSSDFRVRKPSPGIFRSGITSIILDARQGYNTLSESGLRRSEASLESIGDVDTPAQALKPVSFLTARRSIAANLEATSCNLFRHSSRSTEFPQHVRASGSRERHENEEAASFKSVVAPD